MWFNNGQCNIGSFADNTTVKAKIDIVDDTITVEEDLNSISMGHGTS